MDCFKGCNGNLTISTTTHNVTRMEHVDAFILTCLHIFLSRDILLQTNMNSSCCRLRYAEDLRTSPLSANETDSPLRYSSMYSNDNGRDRHAAIRLNANVCFACFVCSPVQDDRDLALQREALMQRHLPGSEDNVGEDPLATSPAQLAIPPAHSSASDYAGPVRLELGMDAEMLDKILDELDEVKRPLSVLPLCLKDELLAQCTVELSANKYDTYVVGYDAPSVL